MKGTAIFSLDMKHRYTLWRTTKNESSLWGPTVSGYVVFIGLNPSTADEFKDDNTVRRCTRFAERWGHGTMCMLNLFGYRSTAPEKMLKHWDPIGPDNDRLLEMTCSKAARIICAWGNHGKHLNRDAEVLAMLRQFADKVHYLRLTGLGCPEHPLYLPKGLAPVRLWP